MEDDREEFVEKETEKEKEVVRPTTEAEGEGEESGNKNVAKRQETEIDIILDDKKQQRFVAFVSLLRHVNQLHE